MPSYLLTLSLGPVQGLIGAARRTRDLWCGSWLLSEAARAAALVLHQAQPGSLIFPCPDDPTTELAPRDGPTANGADGNIANILRAQLDLPNRAAAAALAAQARAAAGARLCQLGQQARKRLGVPLRDAVWAAQIDDLLETFAAWVEVPDPAAGYAAASTRVGGLLAARKATHAFIQAPPIPGAGLPKSSLDGARETVLPDWPPGHRARLQLGLSTNEQLDALGVIKRMAVGAEQFTAYSRLAADPWLQGLHADERARLVAAYAPLLGFNQLHLATGVHGNGGTYQDFPFDGQLLFDFRRRNAEGMLQQLLDDPALARDDLDQASAAKVALAELATTLRDIARGPAGSPVPYAVILKADGDRMGRLLQAAQSADQARAISRALHDFASAVRATVRDQRGHAIYAGGDDVLALLPLAGAAACARALADRFRAHLGPVATALQVPAKEQPTLSVGLGIGHLMEPLGALRARAEAAEHLAKGNGRDDERNALAIILGVRGGSDQQWRRQWTDAPAHAALAAFTQAFAAGQLPSRVPYDLAASARWLARLRDDASATAAGMRQAEVQRILDRARIEGGAKAIDPAARDLLLARAAAESLADLAASLIIARWLAARTATDVGEQP